FDHRMGLVSRRNGGSRNSDGGNQESQADHQNASGRLRVAIRRPPSMVIRESALRIPRSAIRALDQKEEQLLQVRLTVSFQQLARGPLSLDVPLVDDGDPGAELLDLVHRVG